MRDVTYWRWQAAKGGCEERREISELDFRKIPLGSYLGDEKGDTAFAQGRGNEARDRIGERRMSLIRKFKR